MSKDAPCLVFKSQQANLRLKVLGSGKQQMGALGGGGRHLLVTWL